MSVNDSFTDATPEAIPCGLIQRIVWNLRSQPNTSNFVRVEGTFNEVDNQRDSSAIRDFAVQLGLSAWPKIDYLVTRLEFLRSVAPEEGPPLDWDSLTDFLRFLASHSWARNPQLTITPRGMLRAQWRSAGNRHFASEFLGEGQCSFVLFAPDVSDPSKIARIPGMVSLRSLLDTVRPYKVESWLQDGE